jgi:hypothetical protein
VPQRRCEGGGKVKKKNFIAPARIRNTSRPAHSQVTTLTELPRLILVVYYTKRSTYMISFRSKHFPEHFVCQTLVRVVYSMCNLYRRNEFQLH